MHALVRDAAYAAVARDERAYLHEGLARWLESRGGAGELVGMHLERAALSTAAASARTTLSREAAVWLGRAGREAVLASDAAGARNLLERALTLLDEDAPDRPELGCLLGQAYKGLGQLEDAVVLLEGIVARARTDRDRRIEMRARVELVWPRLLDGSWSAAEARNLVGEASAGLGELDDVYGVARAEMTAALVLGDFMLKSDLAAGHAERARRAYRKLGITGQGEALVVAHAVRGSVPVPKVLAVCDETMIRCADRPGIAAYLHCWRALLLALGGDLAGVRDAALRGRAELANLGEEAGLRTSAAALLGSAEAVTGDWRSARDTFESSLAYTRENSGNRAWTAYFSARLGEVALQDGNDKAAFARAEEAEALSSGDDLITEICWRRVLGRACARRGHSRKASRLIREAVEIADSSDDLLEQGEARIDVAEVLTRIGKLDDARDAARVGLGLLERKGASLPVANARRRLAKLGTELGAGGAETAAPPARLP